MMKRMVKKFQFINIRDITNKYIIKNHQYLIKAKPKRPANAFEKYFASFKSSQTNPISSKMILLKQWEQQSLQIKQRFNLEAELQKTDYLLVKQAYLKKYVLPFTHSNPLGLALQKAYIDGKLINNKSNLIYKEDLSCSEYLKTISNEEKLKLKAQSKAINSQRQKLRSEFKFPPKLYSTKMKFILLNQLNFKGKTNIEQIQKLKEKEYETYQNRWKAEVEKWLIQKKYQLSIDQFALLYNFTFNDEIKFTCPQKQVEVEEQYIEGEQLFEEGGELFGEGEEGQVKGEL